jgi:hypothetical protein
MSCACPSTESKISPASAGGLKSRILAVQLGPPWQFWQPASSKSSRPRLIPLLSLLREAIGARTPRAIYVAVASRSAFRPEFAVGRRSGS